MAARTASRRTAPRRRALRRPSRLLALLLSGLFSSLVAAQILPPLPPAALPSGGQVVVGSGRISASGSAMVVDQATQRLGIDWQRFEIGSAASVEFRQPSASSVALNRVIGNDATRIFGRLTANGQVLLTNPSGVVFAPGAKVDVGGLVASGLDLSQQDFAAGRWEFRDAGGAGSVTNAGRIAAARGGYVALFGKDVANDGEIAVAGGSVMLASGRAATVAISGSGLLTAVVTPGAAGEVAHRGLIDAPGSVVTMTASSAQAQAQSLVNSSGLVRANALVERNGEVWITGDRVNVAGTIRADGQGAAGGGTVKIVGGMERGSLVVDATISARGGEAGGDGGSVETSAAQVTIAPGTRVDTRAPAGRTGTWTIDPTDFRVVAGGGAQTTSSIGADTLSTNLATSSVTLQTAAADPTPNENGDLFVDAAVSWSANTTLTLQAIRDVNVNAAITATGNSAGLVITPGAGGSFNLRSLQNGGPRITLSGTSPTLSIAGRSYTVVNSLAALQAIGTNTTTLSGAYALGSSFDISAVASQNGGAGFDPISGSGFNDAFRGVFDGFNHTLTGLTINRPAEQTVGMFGYASNATIRNLNLAGGSVTGDRYVGAFVGYADGSSTLRNLSSSLPVTALSRSGTNYAGGIVGIFYGSGGITDATATAPVFAAARDFSSSFIGGIAGYVGGGAILRAAATGNVTGDPTQATQSSNFGGGLVGQFDSTGGITDSSASGHVTGAYYGGGLVGYHSGRGAISGSSASGSVAGRYMTGGLVGYLGQGPVSNSFATGAVTSTNGSYTGGLAGYVDSYNTNSLTDVSASGAVSATTGYAGGLVGWMYGYSTGGITNARASGHVQGTPQQAGGLIGGYAGSSSVNVSGIRQASATGNVTAVLYAGGLVGQYQAYQPVIDSFATGNVTASGTSSLAGGGLLGYVDNFSSTRPIVQRSYASGDVTVNGSTNFFQDTYGGGLIGRLSSNTASNPSVIDAYSSSRVSVTQSTGRVYVGGLAGYVFGSLRNVYAEGAVSVGGNATRQVGGLVGLAGSGSTATASYWNSATTGLAASALGSALDATQARQAASYSGWDLATTANAGTVWRQYEGRGAPLLAGFLEPLSLTLANATKVYDGTRSFAGANLGGGIRADRILVATGSADVGSYSIAAADVYSVQTGGYDLGVSGSATLTVDPRPLTLTGVVADKVYDGTRAATLAGTAQPAGLVAGERLAVDTSAVSAIFDTKDAGANKSVTLSGYALADDPGGRGKASNYSLANATTTTASITKAPLVVGGFSAAARAYDGTTSVGVTLAQAAISGRFGSDDVDVSVGALTGTLADRNAGVDKPVTVGGVALTGSDAGNYAVAGLADLRVTIAPKAVTVDGLTAQSRQYNGSTNVSVGASSATLAGLVGNDVAILRNTSYTGTIPDRNVGTARPVTVGNLALVGPDAANYTPQQGNLTVDITPRQVTIFAFNSNNETTKVYDGNASAQASLSISNNIDGSNLTAGFTSKTYANKTAGTNKTITVSGLSLGGSAASNYTLTNTTATVNGTITPKPLSVTGVVAANRVYDGSRDVDVDVSNAAIDTSGVIANDQVSPVLPSAGTVVGTVADKNVGNNKAVTVPGLSLTGADAANYSLGAAGGVTVNITRKPVSVTYAGIDKVYDGDIAARIVASTNDFVAGDSVRFYSNWWANNGQSPFFGARFTGTGAKNVGTAKPIQITFDQLIDGDASNYSFTPPSGTVATAAVTPRPINPVYSSPTKVYDGSAAVTVTANTGASGVVCCDNVTFTQNAAFTGAGAKNVGTSKPISVTNIAIGGADVGNYTLSATTAAATGRIDPKPVGVTGVVGVDRAYDGTTSVQVTVTGAVGITGLVAGDDATPVLPQGNQTTGTVANRNAAQNKPVTVTGITLAGADAANYQFDGSGVSVNITPKPLTVAYTGTSREYNGTASASVVASSADVVSVNNVRDNVNFRQTAAFTGSGAKNAGQNKTIAVSAIEIFGNDAANYALQNTTATTTASIVPRSVSVFFTGVDRVYNGIADTSASVVGQSARFVPGDDISLTQTASFADGNAGANKPVTVTNIALAGADRDNYTIASATASTTATIRPRRVGVAGFTAVNREYDGTNLVQVNATGTPSVNPAEVVAGDTLSLVVPQGGVTSGTVSNPNAGLAKPVTLSGLAISGSGSSNYELSGTGFTVDIAPKPVTAVYAGVDRVYDGSVNVGITGSSVDFLGIDAGLVGIGGSGVFTGAGAKNVGQNKPVAVSAGALTGPARFNYALQNASGSTTASVTPKTLATTFVGGSRVYDGGVAAPVTGSLGGIVGGDQVEVTQTAVFSGPNAKAAGNNKPVAVSDIALGGADAANYAIAGTTAVTTASITPKPLTVQGLTGVSARDRVYDGTAIVVVDVAGSNISANSSDIVGNDDVTINVPAAGQTTGTMFNNAGQPDKHVGQGKAVVVTGLSLSGADRDNYRIVGASGVSVNITPKSLTASYAGLDKVYDGTTSATVGGSSGDIVGVDAVAIAGSGVFTGAGAKNVGTNKPVDVTAGRLEGADARNYALQNLTGSTTASITRRTLDLSYTSPGRVYDGTTLAPVTPVLNNRVAGDELNVDQVALFTGAGAKNVGTNKPILVGDIILGGADAGNYRLAAGNATTTGSITPRPVSIEGLTGIAATNRVYDGTSTVQVTISGSGTPAPRAGDIIVGDAVTLNLPGLGATTGTVVDANGLPDKRAGQGKAVVVDGLSLSGADAPNYRIANAQGVSVDIAPKPLTATYVGVDKVYDGSAAATVTGTSSAVLGNDVVAIGGSAVFTGAGAKNVGANKAIEVTAGVLSGADAANYLLQNPTGSAFASITPRLLSPVWTGGSRVYDGGIAAPVSVALGGRIAGDAVTLTQTAEFTGPGAKNVGSNKPVSITQIALGGADAGNYTLGGATSAQATATVTPRPLTITGLSGMTAQDRVYDGTAIVQVAIGAGGGTPTSADIVQGDVVTIGGQVGGQTTGTMLDKHAGTNKPVQVSGLTLGGADAFNYVVGPIAGLSVNITPRTVNVAGFVPQNRLYDGTTTVAIDSTNGSLSGALGGDDVRVAASGVTGSVADKNVGSAKAVTLGGVGLAGSDARNYTMAASDLRVDITPRPLAVTASVADRFYDGTTAATPVFADDRVAGDRLQVGASRAAFADKNAGNAKAVAVEGLTLAGDDRANYSLGATALAAVGNILPAPVTVTPSGLQKVYGDAYVFAGSEFVAAGLVSGETIGRVALASPGAETTAAAGFHPATASAAEGGTFDPANYALSYVPGQFHVTPRPLTIAARNVVRYVGDTSPLPLGFSTNAGGLVNGDTVASATVTPPPGLAEAAGGSVLTLTPSAAVFGSGSAANYTLAYRDGVVVVLPKQPEGEAAAGGPGKGTTQFIIEDFTPEEQRQVRSLLANAAATLGQPGTTPAAPRRDLRGRDAVPPPPVDGADGARRPTLPDLLRTPLISLDAPLRRLVLGTE